MFYSMYQFLLDDNANPVTGKLSSTAEPVILAVDLLRAGTVVAIPKSTADDLVSKGRLTP